MFRDKVFVYKKRTLKAAATNLKNGDLFRLGYSSDFDEFYIRKWDLFPYLGTTFLLVKREEQRK